MWVFTVVEPKPRSMAISLERSPFAKRRRTASSRGDRSDDCSGREVWRKGVNTFRQTSRPEQSSDLSPREEAVLRLLAKGLRSKEIAIDLGLGSTTVNTHIRRIYEKLHVRS